MPNDARPERPKPHRYQEVGIDLQAALTRSGMSVEELAEQTHFRARTIRRYLSGERLAPEEVILAVCEAASTDPATLLRLRAHFDGPGPRAGVSPNASAPTSSERPTTDEEGVAPAPASEPGETARDPEQAPVAADSPASASASASAQPARPDTPPFEDGSGTPVVPEPTGGRPLEGNGPGPQEPTEGGNAAGRGRSGGWQMKAIAGAGALVVVVVVGVAIWLATRGEDEPSGARQGTQQPQPAQPPGKRVPIRVDNRVLTDGLLGEDDAKAVLSPRAMPFGGRVPGTEKSTNEYYDAAVCQIRPSPRQTVFNYNVDNAADRRSPDRYKSDQYYGIRLRDGREGYLSFVYVARPQRTGLGLPRCPSDFAKPPR